MVQPERPEQAVSYLGEKERGARHWPSEVSSGDADPPPGPGEGLCCSGHVTWRDASPPLPSSRVLHHQPPIIRFVNILPCSQPC